MGTGSDNSRSSTESAAALVASEQAAISARATQRCLRIKTSTEAAKGFMGSRCAGRMIETLRHRRFQSAQESLAVAIQSLPSKRHSLTIDIRQRSRSLSLRRNSESTAHMTPRLSVVIYFV